MTIPILELITDKPKETNETIRKQLNDEVTLINIDGSEKLFLTCLLNSSFTSKKLRDYCCEDSANKIIKDHKHMLACVAQVAHFHTHNLKFPKAKVSKQRIIAEPPELHPNVLTSANIESCFGWSDNAANINKSRFFLTQFVWQGNTHSMHELFLERNTFWLDLCKEAGLMRKTEKTILTFIDQNPLSVTFPEKVSHYSKQVCFPIDGIDVSITPVVSHSILVEQERLFKENKIAYRLINHPTPHPSSISKFLGATGGSQKVFDQRPKLPNKRASFNNSRAKKNIHDLLDSFALVKWPMGQTLKDISQLIKETPDKKRKQLYDTFEALVDDWLIPIKEWRRHLMLGTAMEFSTELSAKDTLLKNLLSSNDITEPAIVNDLFPILLQHLCRNKWTECFAYHPAIIKSAKPILRRSLKKLNNCETLSCESDEQYCLHLKQLKITRANALSNPYILGLPSLTALYGFVRRFLINLNKLTQNSFKLEGIAWFIHEYHDYQIYAKPPLELKKPKSEKVKSPLPVAEWHCDLVMDIVLPLKFSDNGLPKVSHELLLASLPVVFASGSVHLATEIDLEQHVHLGSQAEILDVLSRLPASGRWVIPTSEKLKSFEDAAEKLKYSKNYRLANLGFSLLEEPCIRKNSERNLHAYAESSIGLVELINPIDFRRAGMKDFFSKVLWRYSQENKLLYMKLNHSYKH